LLPRFASLSVRLASAAPTGVLAFRQIRIFPVVVDRLCMGAWARAIDGYDVLFVFFLFCFFVLFFVIPRTGAARALLTRS
jgi:hypothetical protein